jgi:hypothetical protein
LQVLFAQQQIPRRHKCRQADNASAFGLSCGNIGPIDLKIQVI